MKIQLITPKVYNTLVAIQTKYPRLTFRNEGYKYVDKSKFTKSDRKAFARVETILKSHITGFSEFNNFRLNLASKKMEIRFQYNWTADEEEPSIYYIGVGYLELLELLNGFNK